MVMRYFDNRWQSYDARVEFNGQNNDFLWSGSCEMIMQHSAYDDSFTLRHRGVRAPQWWIFGVGGKEP